VIEAGNRVYRRSVHHGRADGRDAEVRVLLLDEIERRLLGECLAGAIGGGAVRALGGLVGDWVPVGFGVGVAGPVAFVHVDDGGEGGGDDDALDGRVVLLDCFEDLARAVDGWVEEVTLVVFDLCLEGRGGVNDLSLMLACWSFAG